MSNFAGPLFVRLIRLLLVFTDVTPKNLYWGLEKSQLCLFYKIVHLYFVVCIIFSEWILCQTP